MYGCSCFLMYCCPKCPSDHKVTEKIHLLLLISVPRDLSSSLTQLLLKRWGICFHYSPSCGQVILWNFSGEGLYIPFWKINLRYSRWLPFYHVARSYLAMAFSTFIFFRNLFVCFMKAITSFSFYTSTLWFFTFYISVQHSVFCHVSDVVRLSIFPFCHPFTPRCISESVHTTLLIKKVKTKTFSQQRTIMNTATYDI